MASAIPESSAAVQLPCMSPLANISSKLAANATTARRLTSTVVCCLSGESSGPKPSKALPIRPMADAAPVLLTLQRHVQAEPEQQDADAGRGAFHVGGVA